MKLLKGGKRVNARLRRYHLVTSFDRGLTNPRKYFRVLNYVQHIFPAWCEKIFKGTLCTPSNGPGEMAPMKN